MAFRRVARASELHAAGNDPEPENADVLAPDFEEKYADYSLDEIRAAFQAVAEHRAEIARPFLQEKYDLGDYEEYGPQDEDDPVTLSTGGVRSAREQPILMYVTVPSGGKELVRVVRVEPERDPDLLMAHREMLWLVDRKAELRRKEKAEKELASVDR